MKKKKLLKRILIILLLFITLLIALPFLLKDTIIKKYVEKINTDYNIDISYNKVDISLLKHFPNATLTIRDLNITTEKPFEADTLFFSKSIYLDINIKDIFKTDIEKINVKELTFENSKLNLLVNKQGINNYTVSKIDKTLTSKNENNKISDTNEIAFKVDTYKFKDANILFEDKKNGLLLNLQDLNHIGAGDFTASKMDLNTKTDVKELTLKLGNVTYFNKAKIDLDAILGIDFEQSKYVFKENKAKINNLNLSFDGFVKLNENDIDTDISFNSPMANFKSVLSLIPSAYSSNFDGVTASGVANVSGFVKGKSSDSEIPKYSIKIKTENAKFKYPDLPKTVENIDFDGAIVNNSKKNNMFLNINKLKFTIDEDTFEGNGKITNLITNPTFDTAVKGTLNLEKLTQAYPIELDKKLTGILVADFTTQADQNSIKNNNFDKIKTNGTASLKDFSYKGDDIANTVYVKNANVKFNTNTISLTDFNAKTGKSDIKATGTLDNLYAFLFDKKDLKGDFKVVSNNFVVSDFLVEDNSKSTTNNTKNEGKSTNSESLKIPDFLDVTTTINAKTVVYDNLTLNDVSGIMNLKDQKVILKNAKAKMLNGDVAFSGIVDTKKTPSVFDLDLLINDFDIAKSFNQLETFKKLIPIAKAFKGKYDTSFNVKGKLNDDFSPDMNSLSGKALAQLFVDEIDKNENLLFQALSSNLKFLDPSKLNLKNLKTALTFENGRVSVKPFDLKYKDITMHISGNHGFDKSLQYNMNMDLPAKYLGNDAANLLSQLTNVNKDTITIPLNALINGSVLKPNVKANFKQAMTDLAVKVAKYQKDQLINQATNQVTEVINDAIKDNDVIKDVVGDNDVVNDVVNDILNGTGILKPKPKDSTGVKPNNNNGIINNAANDLINGIFGKKKKKKKKNN